MGEPPSSPTRALINSGLIYLSDFWNFSRLHCDPGVIDVATAAAREIQAVSLAAMRNRLHAVQQHTFNHTPYVEEELEKRRAAEVPAELPQVGEAWADTTTAPITTVVGSITHCDELSSGPVAASTMMSAGNTQQTMIL